MRRSFSSGRPAGDVQRSGAGRSALPVQMALSDRPRRRSVQRSASPISAGRARRSLAALTVRSSASSCSIACLGFGGHPDPAVHLAPFRAGESPRVVAPPSSSPTRPQPRDAHFSKLVERRGRRGFHGMHRIGAAFARFSFRANEPPRRPRTQPAPSPLGRGWVRGIRSLDPPAPSPALRRPLPNGRGDGAIVLALSPPHPAIRLLAQQSAIAFALATVEAVVERSLSPSGDDSLYRRTLHRMVADVSKFGRLSISWRPWPPCDLRVHITIEKSNFHLPSPHSESWRAPWPSVLHRAVAQDPPPASARKRGSGD